MNALAPRPPARMTLAEFLDWDPGDDRRWELVDGVPEPMAPAVRTHGVLEVKLASRLDAHLETLPGDWSVIAQGGIVPKLPGFHFRIPDLVVVRGGYEDEEKILAEPIIAIEILSTGNAGRTRRNLDAYRTIPSLREIVVLHTTRIAADWLARDAAGTWPDRPAALGPDADLVLPTIGFRTPLAGLYRGTRLAPRA